MIAIVHLPKLVTNTNWDKKIMLIGYKIVLIIETCFILKYKLSALNPTHFLKTIVFPIEYRLVSINAVF